MKVHIGESATEKRQIDIPLDGIEYSRKYISVTPQLLLFQIYFTLQLVSLVCIFITHGELVGNIIWSGDSGAIFPDFVQTLWHSYKLRPYDLHAIYPPLVYVICDFLTTFLPRSVLEEVGVNSAYDNWLSASINPAVHVLAVVFFLVATLVLLKLVSYVLNHMGIAHRKVVMWVLLTSTPYLFTIERGNVVIWAVIALLFYCVNYQSEDNKTRLLAYFCLAVAVSLKLYPVVLGILILQGKRPIRRALECIGIGIAVLFLPFSLTGGISSIQVMLSNLMDQVATTSADELALRHKVGITSVLSFVNKFTDLSVNAPDLYNQLASTLPMVVILVGVVGSFLLKSRWKKITILTITIILFPNFSLQYNVLYMLIPLILFLREESLNTPRLNYFYAVLLALCFAPLAFGSPDILSGYHFDFHVNLGMIMPAFAMILLMIVLFLDGLVSRIKRTHADTKTIRRINTRKYFISSSAIILAVVLVLGGSSCFAEQYITQKTTPVLEVLGVENVYPAEQRYDDVDQQVTFHWVDKTAKIVVQNNSKEKQQIRISFKSGAIMTIRPGLKITVACGGQQQSTDLTESGQTFSYVFEIDKGITNIEITSNAPRIIVDPSADNRNLYFVLEEFTISDLGNGDEVHPLDSI